MGTLRGLGTLLGTQGPLLRCPLCPQGSSSSRTPPRGRREEGTVAGDCHLCHPRVTPLSPLCPQCHQSRCHHPSCPSCHFGVYGGGWDPPGCHHGDKGGTRTAGNGGHPQKLGNLGSLLPKMGILGSPCPQNLGDLGASYPKIWNSGGFGGSRTPKRSPGGVKGSHRCTPKLPPLGGPCTPKLSPEWGLGSPNPQTGQFGVSAPPKLCPGGVPGSRGWYPKNGRIGRSGGVPAPQK